MDYRQLPLASLNSRKQREKSIWQSSRYSRLVLVIDMGQVTIEPARLEDAEPLANISKRAFDSDVEVGAPSKGGPSGYDSAESQRNLIENKAFEYLKILYDGRIVGATTVHRFSEGHYEIFNVFIDPDYHRKGVGTRSFELIKKRYPQVKRWTLDTPVWNVRTKEYYEKLGFVQYGIFRWVPNFDLRAYELILDPDCEHDITRIAEVSEGDDRYIIKGMVESISPSREVFSKKDGKYHKVAEGILTDNSASMKFVLWDDMIRQVMVGERIRVETAYVSKFRDELQLNVSKYGRIAIL